MLQLRLPGDQAPLIALAAGQGVHQLQLHLQCLAPALLAPQQQGLAATAGSLFTGGGSPEPTERLQLAAVAQAGIQIPPPGSLLDFAGQLLLPPVGPRHAGGQQAEGYAQPDPGQPVPAQAQGKGLAI